MLLSLPTSAKQLPKPRPAPAVRHCRENQGRAAPAAREACLAGRSRARGAQRERSAEQEHSPASPGPARPDRDLARLTPSPSLRPSENLLLPAGFFPAIYGAGLTRCSCERPSPGKQLPRACSPKRGGLSGCCCPIPWCTPQAQTHSSTCGRGLHTAAAPLGDVAPFPCAPARAHHPQPQLSRAAAALVALLSKGCPGSRPKRISHPKQQLPSMLLGPEAAPAAAQPSQP